MMCTEEADQNRFSITVAADAITRGEKLERGKEADQYHFSWKIFMCFLPKPKCACSVEPEKDISTLLTSTDALFEGSKQGLLPFYLRRTFTPREEAPKAKA